MDSFEAMGHAKLSAAEGQRLVSIQFNRWLGRVILRWFDAMARHMPEGRLMPW